MSNSQIHLEHALVDVTDMAESLPFYQRLFPDWTIRWQGHSRGAP